MAGAPRYGRGDPALIPSGVLRMAFHIVVCAGLVPDPLQSLEPVTGPAGPGLKNETLLPSVIDPWAAHALFEAAHLAKAQAGSKVWLVTLAPKAKLQQVLMLLAQKVPFELVAVDGAANGFTDASACAAILADAIAAIPGLDRKQLLLFGGWESASRAAGTTLQIVGERLGIAEQFQGVDAITVQADGSFEVLERIEGGRHQVSTCSSPPAVLGWATGSLHEPPNNPQLGMTNMRTMMPALQKAKATPVPMAGTFGTVAVPSARRDTRVVKDMTPDAVAQEIVEWIRQ